MHGQSVILNDSVLNWQLCESFGGLLVVTLHSDPEIVGWNPVAHQWIILFVTFIYAIPVFSNVQENRHVVEPTESLKTCGKCLTTLV